MKLLKETLLAGAAVLLAAGALSLAAAEHEAYVDPALLERVDTHGSARMLIYLRERADLRPAFEMDWVERGRFVHRQLTTHAARTQAPLLAWLDRADHDYRAFWIDNVIVVDHADQRTVSELAAREEVAALVSEPVAWLPEPDESAPGRGDSGVVSNIVQVGAPQAWDMGFRGEGITVGVIDSGVRYTHEALVEQYRGNQGGGVFEHHYHWFDIDGSTAPVHPNDHGTHVAGTAVGSDGGDNQIGVAPGANWMACLGCISNGSCPGTHLLACGEFMAAPTDLAGENPDPDVRPHVVNNSWSDCSLNYDDWYQSVVDAWVAAGIVPVFANGNASNCGYAQPPGLNTVSNPARYGNVLGIGSSGNSNGEYAIHSNWGPTDNLNPGLPHAPDHFGFPELKPNVVAPGVDIYSAVPIDDASYRSAGWTGTSMSAPHVAGLVALMWDAAPCLIGDYAMTGSIIMETATPIAYDSGGEPPPGPDNVPNYATGWGEIDVLAAVSAVMGLCGPQGVVQGRVVSALTGEPLSGVWITADNPQPPPDQYVTATNADGEYARWVRVLEAPGYTFNFSKPGYQSATVADIVVSEDETVTLGDVPLDAGRLVLPERVELTLDYGASETMAVTLSNTGTAMATANLHLTEESRQDFEGTFPPPGWSVTGGDGSDCVWTRNDEVTPTEGPVDPGHGGRPNFAGGQGFSAAADADACGPGTTTDTTLITPAIDLGASTLALVDFQAAYRHGTTSLFATEISADGGASWMPTLTWDANFNAMGGATSGPVRVDLSAHLGQSDVRLRFRYTAGWHYWAQIDQFRVVTGPFWASAEPNQAGIEPDQSITVEFSVDSSLLPGPGVYELLLTVEHDTPHDIEPVPVTVVVRSGEAEIFSDRFE